MTKKERYGFLECIKKKRRYCKKKFLSIVAKAICELGQSNKKQKPYNDVVLMPKNIQPEPEENSFIKEVEIIPTAYT